GIITQKRAFLSQRNPELPNIVKRFAVYWIKCEPNRSLAVRRLFPWVHLNHGLALSDWHCGFEASHHSVPPSHSRAPQQKRPFVSALRPQPIIRFPKCILGADINQPNAPDPLTRPSRRAVELLEWQRRALRRHHLRDIERHLGRPAALRRIREIGSSRVLRGGLPAWQAARAGCRRKQH